jgi:hypothetical protein
MPEKEYDFTKDELLDLAHAIEMHLKNPLIHVLAQSYRDKYEALRTKVIDQYLVRDKADAEEYFRAIREEVRNA